MKHRFDPKLLDKIKAGEHFETFQGVKVLIKPIPEGGQPGDMDPRLYKSMRMMPFLSHFMPKPKKDATIMDIVKPFRKMFGTYKGFYIANEGIKTDFVSTQSEDGYQVPLRIYKRATSGNSLPIFIYFHGGGFFGGSQDIVEQMCKLLVQEYDCICINVGYRLCPENHYPQPFNDCWAAVKWAFENADSLNGDPNKIAVGGDSAGGNLAATIALKDREEESHLIKLQVLLYPAVNLAGTHTEFYQGVDISKYRMSKRHSKVIKCVLKTMTGMMNSENFLDNVYLQGNISSSSIYASPLLDDFHDIPKTLLIFGEHDMLAMEDFAYARTAVKAGVDIKTVIYEGMSHGFADQIGVCPQADDAIRTIAEELKEVFK